VVRGSHFGFHSFVFNPQIAAYVFDPLEFYAVFGAGIDRQFENEGA
jgi:hypothetical protein